MELTPSPALELRAVSKSFAGPVGAVMAVSSCDLQLRPGRVVAVVGRSGSGKSTLLHVAGLLTRPDDGQVLVDGTDATALRPDEVADLRRRRIGVVFQGSNLVPQHSALANVALPHVGSRRDSEAVASALLERVGLAARAGHRPGQLSGGEQQRVAVARALVNSPSVLLADEPTGNLDADSEAQVLALLRSAADDGAAVLLVTHSATAAAAADEILRMDVGVLGGPLKEGVAS